MDESHDSSLHQRPSTQVDAALATMQQRIADAKDLIIPSGAVRTPHEQAAADAALGKIKSEWQAAFEEYRTAKAARRTPSLAD